jgi:hypothetical protein
MSLARPQLFVRQDGRVVEAPEADIAVAEGYASWPDKGPLVDGRRLTIMAAQSPYAVGDAVRIIHVLEVTTPDLPLYVMGPKPVLDEYVDGRLVTGSPPQGVDPLLPDSYDGRTLKGPGLDFNWEITSYRFAEPGRHEVVWRPGGLSSNKLFLGVGEKR